MPWNDYNALTNYERAVNRIIRIQIRLYPYPYLQSSDSDTDNIRFTSDTDKIRFFSDTNVDISDRCQISLMAQPYSRWF